MRSRESLRGDKNQETTEADWFDNGGAIHPVSQYGMHVLTISFLNNLKEVERLHFKKGADYGTKENPFHNITEAEKFGIPPWKSALNRANDNMVRLQKLARDGELESDVARDAFLDGANYLLIALTLWETDEKESKTSS